MRNVKILDCTLRDGARIIDCKIADSDILNVAEQLTDSNIDIIELGFLRDSKKVTYKGDSTFFTDVEQIEKFIPSDRKKSKYVAFVDYGMFDFDTLKPYDGKSIDGLRVGFTKKNYLESKEDIIKCLKSVKEKGYELMIQGVNSLGYKDKELLEIVDFVNEIKPYSFGIVDTYGAMYVDDLRRIYALVDNNMLSDIAIDFHSHNNYQLSFSFAQEIIDLSNGTRNIIIDSTLNGMGKVAGNLCTELIINYLNTKLSYNYDFEKILDIIDDYIYRIKKTNQWGYSIPAMVAGIYKSHPNNIIYLLDKYRLDTKDIKHIVSMIDPDKRQRYDYDNIQNLYINYNHTKVNDDENIKKISGLLKNRNLLIVMPGNSVEENKDRIIDYIRKNNSFVISVNHVFSYAEKKDRMSFFGSTKRYEKADIEEENVIVVSNVTSNNKNDLVVNYESLIERDNNNFDNTTIMLLNLLKRLNITKFAIAGFDGYTKDKTNYYNNFALDEGRFEDRYNEINEDMKKMLTKYAATLDNKNDVLFITPSIYEYIFK